MLLVFFLLLSSASSAPLTEGTDDSQPTTFHPDCADPHNTEVACTVHLAACHEQLLLSTTKGKEPPEPHDLRIEVFSKATARGKNAHQLHVDLSWQMPPKNESANLKAFRLEILGPNGKKTCFNFNVSKFSFNEEAASPRFHFTTDSIFDFSKTYTATLFSLPASKERKPHASRTKTMPENMEMVNDNPDNITEYCKTHSHSEASKWTAGFRKIFLQSITRTIQLEFVGAPPQYCFEEYEVRLLDETGIEVLFYTIIKASDMKKEFIDNKWVSFGEYNFTGLDLDIDYIPSVIPVDMAADGRCLCPTSEQHGACSCIAADWKKVRLHRIQKPVINRNATLPPVIIEPKGESELQTILIVILILLASVAMICVAVTFVVCCCRKCKPVEKTTRIRFVGNTMTGSAMDEPQVPLIAQCKLSVLIIYAHDGSLHDASVIAFAELLKNTFGFNVHLDVWDMEEIEQNLAEYVNSAIVRADKIIIVNSLGAFVRTKARHMKEDPVERVSPSPVDELFTMQIDLALQHARVISMRFSYTPSSCVIYSLTPLLQYSVPDNLGLLVASLADSTLKNDSRLTGYSPELVKLTNAVNRMSEYMANDLHWFEKLHHRVQAEKIEAIKVPVTTSPKRAIAIVPASPMSQERSSLITEEIEEEQEQQPIVASGPESIPDEPIESGFASGMVESTEIEEEEKQEVSQEVLDKPRIRETMLEPKDPRHGLSGDSGIISDLQSGQLTV